MALDAMVENLSPARVIAVITTEDMITHKNPTIRYGDNDQPSRSKMPKLRNMGTPVAMTEFNTKIVLRYHGVRIEFCTN